MPLAQFAVPNARTGRERGRQHRPGRLRRGPDPLPLGQPAHARMSGRRARSAPRLRLLRQAAGALVLVHARRRLREPGGRLRAGLPQRTRAGSTSCRSTSATHLRGPEADRGSTTGLTPSVWTATVLSPTSIGSGVARPSSTPIPAASSRRPRSGSWTTSSSSPRWTTLIAASKQRAADGALMVELPQDWEVAPEPGWIEPALAEEFPGPLDRLDGPRDDDRPQPRGPEGARCGRSATESAARRRSSSARSRSPGRTASSSATSASTPTPPAPRSSS